MNDRNVRRKTGEQARDIDGVERIPMAAELAIDMDRALLVQDLTQLVLAQGVQHGGGALSRTGAAIAKSVWLEQPHILFVEQPAQ